MDRDESYGVSHGHSTLSPEQSQMVSLDLNRLGEPKQSSDATLVPPVPDVEAMPVEADKAVDPVVPPDGGFRAWLQVAGGFFIFFNIWSV